MKDVLLIYFTEWIIFSLILENFTRRQKYFFTNVICDKFYFWTRVFQMNFCLERELCWSQTPLSAEWSLSKHDSCAQYSKKIENDLPYVIMRQRDSITRYINGSLSIRFKSKAQCIIDQYNNYKVGNLSVNGVNTQVTHFTFTSCLFGHFPNSF